MKTGYPWWKAIAPVSAAIRWGLSGFSNTTVWLIFAAFMFALGYEKSGLGKRIALQMVKRLGKRALTLGYAVTIADLIIAPFTPSNTARSGGTIYPVIRNLPALYDSKPDDPSARRMGAYLMWMAISATCITTTLFLTALAPNSVTAHVTAALPVMLDVGLAIPGIDMAQFALVAGLGEELYSREPPGPRAEGKQRSQQLPGTAARWRACAARCRWRGRGRREARGTGQRRRCRSQTPARVCPGATHVL